MDKLEAIHSVQKLDVCMYYDKIPGGSITNPFLWHSFAAVFFSRKGPSINYVVSKSAIFDLVIFFIK